MTACPAIYSETIWLREPEYTVAALNSKLSGYIKPLSDNMKAGVIAYPDLNRRGFYSLQIGSAWHYVNVHDETRTVYLIAVS